MSVQNNIATGYLSSFELPIGVSVMSKLTQWKGLQELGFAGNLNHHNLNFHGLKDFKFQLDLYSSTNFMLKAAFSVIKKLIPNNPILSLLLYPDPALGLVGKQFQGLANFNQVFAVSPTELKTTGAVASKIAALT